ncbi:hypothetical protein P8452_38524 [Trifolium repens]|nr:hypothetical protein P8452_38524 [Trifolium repens]
MLLRDIKGDTIQAIIMRDNIEKWKPKLSEGKCYYMRNFKVVDYDASFKMCKQKFMLAFLPIATKVEEIDNPGIPLSKFNFKDLSEIQAGKYVPDLLVGKCVTTSNNKKGSDAFTLQDLRENVLDVALWDALSVEFISSYNKRTVVGPIVVIIKHGRVKEATGTYPLQLTNVWNGTKILFDANLPEIKAFVASLPKNVN